MAEKHQRCRVTTIVSRMCLKATTSTCKLWLIRERKHQLTIGLEYHFPSRSPPNGVDLPCFVLEADVRFRRTSLSGERGLYGSGQLGHRSGRRGPLRL